MDVLALVRSGWRSRRLVTLIALLLVLSTLQAVVPAPADAAPITCVGGTSEPGDHPCCNANNAGGNTCTLPCALGSERTILHGFTVPGIVDVSTVSGCGLGVNNCPAGGFFRRLFRRECNYTSQADSGNWTCTAGLGQTYLCEVYT